MSLVLEGSSYPGDAGGSCVNYFANDGSHDEKVMSVCCIAWAEGAEMLE